MVPMSPDLQSSPVGAPPSRLQRILAYRWLLGLAISILILDQLTKIWITHKLPISSEGIPWHIEVIPGFFYLVHVGNPGAAWSMFSGWSKPLAVLAAVTLVAIYLGRRSLGLRLFPVQLSFGLLIGGIAGNLIDRLQYGYVIDFLDFHFGEWRYPTFNVADCGICIGVISYIWYSLRHPQLK